MKLQIRVCPRCKEMRGGERCIDCGELLDTRLFMDFEEVEDEIQGAVELAEERWQRERGRDWCH